MANNEQKSPRISGAVIPELMAQELTFEKVGRVPGVQDETEAFLLVNRCDGYHLVRAWFSDAGEFEYFYGWGFENLYFPDTYIAWAKLPDLGQLIPVFDKDEVAA